MKEVAKLLGVELEEDFKVYGWDGFCKITELGLERCVKERSWLMDSIVLTALIKGTAKIIKIPKPILTDKEKEYLSAVIKPFRDKVISIANYYEESIDKNFIEIEVKQDYCNENQYVSFPYFKKGTMYKGMEEYKKYTLEELGL